jgi:hypothetical protein
MLAKSHILSYLREADSGRILTPSTLRNPESGKVGLEVTLRNSIDHCLAETYGDAWYFHSEARFDHVCRRQVNEARDRLERNDQELTRSRLLAPFSFGFWVTLLGRGGMLSAKGAKANFEMTLWRPALHKAFPNRPGLARKQAYQPLHYLRTFRNQIAHHEAIFERDLRRDYDKIIRVTGEICPKVGDGHFQAAA